MVSRNGQRARRPTAIGRGRVPVLVPDGIAGVVAGRVVPACGDPPVDTTPLAKSALVAGAVQADHAVHADGAALANGAVPVDRADHSGGARCEGDALPNVVRRRSPRHGMRGAVFAGPGRVEIRELPRPEPGKGEVRVRLAGCGVGASCLPVWEGRARLRYPLEPGAPGHEGYGVVDALGPGVDGLVEGDVVTLLSARAFAEYAVAPCSAVVRLPETLSGQPFPGAPLGGAMHVLERSRVWVGQDVAIVGIGFLGAALTALCARAGARVLALSRRAYALDVARACGAAEVLPLDDPAEVERRVLRLTGGSGCDRVLECAGRQETLDLAARLVRAHGRLTLAGLHPDGPRRVDLGAWSARGLDVVNAHESDPERAVAAVRRAVAAAEARALDPAALCTHRFPLEALGDALEAARTRPAGFLKAVVEP